MEKKFIVNGPIPASLVTEYLGKIQAMTDCGGHTVFLGQVRADAGKGKEVTAIEYSAYEDMVEKEGQKIIEMTKSAFPDIRSIEIVHSTGSVKAGEISLFVIVAAGHRDQAIRGCRHVVEMVKDTYPVWKKEIFEDRSHQWRDNTK